MKSAREQADDAAKKLNRLLGVKKPIFPAMHAKNVENAKQNLAYWNILAAKQDAAAMQGFGQSTGLSDFTGKGKGKSTGTPPATTSLPPGSPSNGQGEAASLFSSPWVLGGLGVLGLAVIGSFLRR